MKVNDVTRRELSIRRQHRELVKSGYVRHETDWQLIRGYLRDQVIVDAKISVCGKYVYTKIGTRNE